MSGWGRRTALTLGVLIPATLVSIVAVYDVTAESSRASNRWNHASSGAAVVYASEAGSEPLYRGPVWKRFRLFEVFGPKFTFVDVGKKGDSPGDYGVFRDPIFNTRGERLGTIDVQCIASYADQCQGSIRIPGRGQIVFGGITPLGRDPDYFAITGGTGLYTGVGGTLMIEFPSANRARLTLTLTR